MLNRISGGGERKSDRRPEYEHKRTNPQKDPLTPHHTLPLVYHRDAGGAPAQSRPSLSPSAEGYKTCHIQQKPTCAAPRRPDRSRYCWRAVTDFGKRSPLL